MPLFTFVLDFDGGTYVSQVRSASWKSAPVAWAKALNADEIYGMGSSTRRLLETRMSEELPVPLNGLKRAWCTSTLLRGKPALIHFVETNS
jgi:hypothetical protein